MGDSVTVIRGRRIKVRETVCCEGDWFLRGRWFAVRGAGFGFQRGDGLQ